MNVQKLLFVLALYITTINTVNSQPLQYGKMIVNEQMKDTFSFAKKWDYSWEVFKDEQTGKFTKNDDQPLTAADTAHLFYTANCFTNVQGGYPIRYCFATLLADIIKLTFADGMPAYASEFSVYINLPKGTYYIKPNTIYPQYVPGQKTTYEITRQSLTLNKSNYKTGDIIMGYINFKFTEITSAPKKGTQKNRFYLRGYIRTTLKRQVQ